jgi:hypothetical protein
MRLYARLTLLAAIFSLCLWAGVGSPVRAAAEPCFGLKPDDCALLQNADKPEALHQLSYFNFEYNLNLNLTSTQREGTILLASDGKGYASLDIDALGKLGRGEMNAVLDKMGLVFVTNNSLKIGSLEQAGGAEIRIVNNTLYLKGEALTGNVWRSVDLKSVTRREGVRQAGLGGLLRGARALVALNRFRATAENFIKAERAADIEFDGQKMAVIQFKVDLNKLFAAKELATLLKSAQELSGEKVTDAEVQESVAILGALGKNLTLTLTRYIGTVDKAPHGFVVSLTGKLDPSVAQPLAGGGSPNGTDIKPIDVTVNFEVKATNLGKETPVAAPPDATPLDLGKEE